MNTFRTVISPSDLHAHLTDPAWVIVDCRFELKNPAWGQAAYLDGHIPGAVYADLNRDLSIPQTAHSGRHPLPPVEYLVDRMQFWGITNESQVVVYDHQGGSIAARLWWTLRYLGHNAVAILDGGFQGWQALGYPLSNGPESKPPAVFHPQPRPDMLASTQEIQELSNTPTVCLIDARAPERYRGETEPFDRVAGHIPGAINRFHGNNLAPTGNFLPPETLRQQFSDLLNGYTPEDAIVYCGSGVTSCHHLAAMEHAGLPGARLYLGSWSEWIADPARPIAKS